MRSILLVDDDEIVRSSLSVLFQAVGFEVTAAASAPEALKLIVSRTFDVLLSDLHMPAPGDGLTVVGAMRQANPDAVTLILTSFPEMDIAAQSIIRQADEILIKPMNLRKMVDVIERRLSFGPLPKPSVESVAAILERSIEEIADQWFQRVQSDERLQLISLSRVQRCGHLLALLHDLVDRLRDSRELGSASEPSVAAYRHGILRRQQGSSVAMMIEESRLLQVSLFHVLQDNLARIDFSRLLLDVMTVADEVDSQLKQAVEAYLDDSDHVLSAPIWAGQPYSAGR